MFIYILIGLSSFLLIIQYMSVLVRFLLGDNSNEVNSMNDGFITKKAAAQACIPFIWIISCIKYIIGRFKELK
jgi:hypothetical protein